MWCPTCQADVAAEMSADHRRLSCARCHTELALSATEPARGGTRIGPVEQSARELLARWSAESLIEAPANGAAQPVSTTPAVDAVPSPMESAPRRDIERSPMVDPAINVVPTVPIAPTDRARWRRVRRRQIQASSAVPQPSLGAPPPRVMPWMATVGQLVAYGGVGGLTCGTALVLWSHFGGPSHYSPTGWLLTTIGQMLLFLGVVTLVAGSLERLTADMDRRMNRIAEQLDGLQSRMRRRRRNECQEDRTAA